MKNSLKYFIGFLAIIIIVGGGFFVWTYYLSPAAKYQRQIEKQYQAYQQWEEQYKDAMKQDTYGGKTPEETLQMFIEALKKGDIELASKYFIIDTKNSREEWKKALEKADGESRLNEVIGILLQAKPDPTAAISKDYYVFAARDENGVVVADIDLRFNSEAGVWKIESL